MSDDELLVQMRLEAGCEVARQSLLRNAGKMARATCRRMSRTSCAIYWRGALRQFWPQRRKSTPPPTSTVKPSESRCSGLNRWRTGWVRTQTSQNTGDRINLFSRLFRQPRNARLYCAGRLG